MPLREAIHRFYSDIILDELQLMNKNPSYPNLTYNTFLYLSMIAYKKNCTASYIAKTLRVSNSAVTIKVNELIRQGLVQKTQNSNDKRVYYLSLAPKFAEDYWPEHRLDNAVCKFESNYTEEQVKMFCDMLNFITKVYLGEQE